MYPSIVGRNFFLRHLAELFGPRQRFYGVRAPVGKRNVGFAVSVEAIAQYYTDNLVNFQPEGPIVLGGWSSGSIIALKMAQQLRGRGRNVLLLVALDGAPFNTGAGINPWNPRYYWRSACNLPRWIRDDIMRTGAVRSLFKRTLKKLNVF